MHSLRLFFAFPCALLTLAACGEPSPESTGSGGSTSTATTGSGAGGAGPVPANHRATAAACTAERPPGDLGGGTDGDCTTDAECAAGDNGRCVANLGEPAFCSYDECAVDDDCGAGSVCECRNPAAHDANVCVHGNCRLDADCGEDGYCSPSAVTLSPFCTEGVAIGSVGYFCHTAADECTDDADCPASGTFPSCFFNVDKLHFACFEVLCVN